MYVWSSPFAVVFRMLHDFRRRAPQNASYVCTYVEARETAVKDRESAVATREADLAEQVAKCDKKKEEQLVELRQLAEHFEQADVCCLCSSIGSAYVCTYV